MSTLEYTVVDAPESGQYEARTPAGEVVGYSAYRRDGDTIVFPHTVVPPEHGGQGIASALAKTSLDDARAAGLTVRPGLLVLRHVHRPAPGVRRPRAVTSCGDLVR